MDQTHDIARWKYLLTIILCPIIALGASSVYFLSPEGHPYLAILIYTVGYILISLLCAYLYNRYVLRGTLADIYICRPLPRPMWIALLLVVAAASIGFSIAVTEGTLTLQDLDAENRLLRMIHTLMIPGVCAGVVEELLFRGLLLRSLQRVWSTRTAILVSAFVFTMTHAGGSLSLDNIHDGLWFILACMIMGTLLALITLETGSIWTGVVMHMLMNQYSWLEVTTVGMEPTSGIWHYAMAREYPWVTGTALPENMEMGIPALLGYVLLLLLALHLYRVRRGTPQT